MKFVKELISMKKILFTLVMLFLLLGCNDNYSSMGKLKMSDSILKNKQLWIESKIDNYQYLYSLVPINCPRADPYPPALITVKAGEISSVFIPDLQREHTNIQDFPTINGLFAKLEEKTVNKQILLVYFDKKMGYPVEYDYQLSKNDCDTYKVKVSKFMKMP